MAEAEALSGAEGSVDEEYDGDELVLIWRPPHERAGMEMARFDPGANLLRIFPKKGSAAGPVDQFDQVTQLQIDTTLLPAWDPTEPTVESDSDGSLELTGLPDGFGKRFAYGLGFPRRYRPLIRRLEDRTSCTVVRFGNGTDEGVHGDVFHIGLDRFAGYRHAVDRNEKRGSDVVFKVNDAEAHNATADLFGADPVQPTLGRLPLIQAMTREVMGEPVLDAADRKMLVEQVTAESRTVAVEAPVAFGKLRQGIELVSLEVLIEQFEQGLTGKAAKSEAHWQDFFEKNSFALQQLFAAPVALYGAQLTLKGTNALGRGSRIADFMLVNTVTRSAVVVEIKTPASGLTGKVYRGRDGAEVFRPHADLIGAVTQVQSQIESARIHLPALLIQTPDMPPLDTCVVRGAVIVGAAGSLGEKEKASFLWYRDGLRDVEVIAFDEVLDRLKGLHELLKSTGDSA